MSSDKCIVCGKDVPGYEPEFCCNGNDCCCGGLPIEPCLCGGKECVEKVYGVGHNKPSERDIRFRGKRVDNGEWAYGAYFCLRHNDDRTHLHHFIIPDDSPIPKDRPIGEIQVEVDPATVGQFTGLRDDLQQEIFEGDVLSITCYSYTEPEDDYHGVVTMGGLVGTGLIYADMNGEKKCQPLWNLTGSYTTQYHVIGNVRDDPELLQEA